MTLDEINAERRKRGKRALTQHECKKAKEIAHSGMPAAEFNNILITFDIPTLVRMYNGSGEMSG